MELDPSISLSAFKFVCGESIHVCRLCFASTENGGVTLEDSVSLNKPYFDETVSFMDMFYDLGILVEPLLPQVLCADCSNIVVDSYLFGKLCQHSNKKWNQVIESITKTLDQTEFINPVMKTACVMMNQDDNVIYTTRKNLSAHSKTVAVSKINKILANRTKFAERKKKDINCKECGEEFDSKTLLNKHRKVHNLEGIRFPCKQCAKVFSTRAQLEDHVERLHYPKNIQCTKCAKMFSTEKMLKRHDKLHHIAAICKLCFIQFASKNALRVHMDSHEDKKCEQCGKSFYNKHTYKLHLKICGNSESRLPVFFCDICKKGYARKNSLRTHLKIDHSFGQALSCSWCSKKFDAYSRLRNHIVKHTKERNFYCDQCGGKFVTQAALVYHIRLHTGERPFPCDLCNESFLSASRRMEHKRRKHLAPTKECSFCHMKFVTTYQLRKHEERHYNPQSKLYVPPRHKHLDANECFGIS